MAASRARFQARSCSSGFESRLLQVLSGRDHSALWASVSSLVRWKDRFSICFLGCLWEFSETLLWREQYQARPDTGLSLSSGAAVAVMQGGSLLGSGCPAPPTLPVSPNLVLKYGGGGGPRGQPRKLHASVRGTQPGDPSWPLFSSESSFSVTSSPG